MDSALPARQFPGIHKSKNSNLPVFMNEAGRLLFFFDDSSDSLVTGDGMMSPLLAAGHFSLRTGRVFPC